MYGWSIMHKKIAKILNGQNPCKYTLTIITSDTQNNILDVTEHRKGKTKRLYKHGD